MSFAKRRQDLRDRRVRKRIEAFLKEEDEMAKRMEIMAEGEHIIVGTEGEHVVLVLEAEKAKCEVRFTLAEVEQFEEALDKMRKRVSLRVEARRSKEATRVDRVEEEDEDFEESE